jgi:hypothetical protein
MGMHIIGLQQKKAEARFGMRRSSGRWLRCLDDVAMAEDIAASDGEGAEDQGEGEGEEHFVIKVDALKARRRDTTHCEG